MARHLIGDCTDREIAQIGFGTDATEPAASDTTLINPFKKAIDGTEFPSAGKVRFNWTLDTSESNGKAIREFGLFCENDTLFARRIRATAINKESDISLEGYWEINF